MSTQSQTSDAFAMYKQNVQKYFENISKLTPQYFQSATELQNECMNTCQKTINAAVSQYNKNLQRKPESTLKFKILQKLQSLIPTSKLFKQVQ